MKQAVIFDFDGTVADTFGLAVDIFYHVTNRVEPLPPEEIAHLRELSLPEVALALGVPLWKIPYLAWRGRRLFADRIHQAAAVPGMAETLKELQGTHDLYVVSSNSVANVRTFLHEHGLSDYFQQIYGNARLHGKARLLGRICQRGDYDRERTVYVGDETRDIEAAHHAGLKSIAVAWGYNNLKALHQHKPDKIIFDPSEIPTYLATIE
jgi:phosphoglycolate phosphatase-like HAD superfamily hydrolase